MSKEIDMQQILLQEDSHANHSALQEREKEHQMTATSGMKLLESSESVNLDGSLGKMLKALLTSKKAWSSDRCVMTWKKKVSKSNVLLFQLAVSVRGIKGKESGSLLKTPTTQDARIGPNNIGGNKHRVKRGSIALADQILFPTPTTMDHIDRKGMRPSRAATNRKSGYLSEMIKMYPTPTRVCEEGGEQSHLVERTKSGGFVSRRKGSGITYGSKLSDAMIYLEKMYPTPTARDYKDLGYQPTWKPSRDQSVPRTVLKNNKPGGKLNPTFVEFLMGYPMNWTKIESTE